MGQDSYDVIIRPDAIDTPEDIHISLRGCEMKEVCMLLETVVRDRSGNMMEIYHHDEDDEE